MFKKRVDIYMSCDCTFHVVHEVTKLYTNNDLLIIV